MRVQLSLNRPVKVRSDELIQTKQIDESGKITTTLAKPDVSGHRVVATIQQTPLAKSSVDFFDGKGGQSIEIKTPDGLLYVLQPGSKFSNGDTWVTMPGKKYEPLLSAPALPRTQTPIQNITDQAIILGAGLGERLDPISGVQSTGFSKPGIPLNGEKSMIRNIAEHMQRHGIKNLKTQTYIGADHIKKELTEVDGLKTQFMHELNMPPGTASSLMKAYMQGDLDMTKPVLIMAGDAITNYDLSYLINKHKEVGAAVTIAAKKVRDDEVHQFGIVESDNASGDGQSGNITVFKEKPKLENAGNSRLANTAIYVISPEALPLLKKVGEELFAKGGNNYDYAMNFFPALLKAVKAGEIKDKDGKPMKFWVQQMNGGYWDDIGNPVSYFRNVLTLAKGYLGIPLSKDINRFVDNNGVIYWNGSKNKVEKAHVKLDGNIIVAQQSQPKPSAKTLAIG